MNKLLIVCDRLMYGALLMMIFVLPYSFALIEASQITMMVAWASRCFLLSRMPGRGGPCPSGFNFASRSMIGSLIAIALLIILTIPFSHYPAFCVKKFFSRFLQQIFVMYVVTQIVHSRKRLHGVLLVLLLTLFFLTIDVMAQYIGGRSIVHQTPLILGRVSGPMNHPNDLGTLLVTVLPVILTLVFTPRQWMPRAGTILVSVLFLVLVSVLGLTDSRGAWLAFVISTITLGVLLKNPKLIMALIFFMLGGFLWVFGIHCLSTRIDMIKAPLLSPSLLNPFGLPSGYNVLGLFFNPDGRQVYWTTAVGIIKHYPWFGCGYSAYGKTLADLHVGHDEFPHNSLLQITAELGLAGLVLYGWFFTALFLQMKNILRVISTDRDLFLVGCGISSGILAWMIHGLLDTAWASLQLSVLWWLFIGILLSLGQIVSRGKTARGR